MSFPPTYLFSIVTVRASGFWEDYDTFLVDELVNPIFYSIYLSTSYFIMHFPLFLSCSTHFLAKESRELFVGRRRSAFLLSLSLDSHDHRKGSKNCWRLFLANPESTFQWNWRILDLGSIWLNPKILRNGGKAGSGNGKCISHTSIQSQGMATLTSFSSVLYMADRVPNHNHSEKLHGVFMSVIYFVANPFSFYLWWHYFHITSQIWCIIIQCWRAMDMLSPLFFLLSCY